MHKAIHRVEPSGARDRRSGSAWSSVSNYVTAAFQDPTGYTKVAEVLKECRS